MKRKTTQYGLVGATAVVSVTLLASVQSSAGATPVAAGRLVPAASEQTVQLWNWDTVGDDPGEHATVPVAITELEKQYHVKVVNTEMTLEEQNDKLPLAFASKSSAPTVSQTNEGFGSMGRLVTDDELINLAGFNKTYHWFPEVGSLPLQYNSFTSNGRQFGSGNVYGVPDSGSIVGIFYNKKLLSEVGGKVPTNWSVFTNDLALLHKAGKVAIAYSGGQPTAYQPVHTLYTIADQYVSAAAQNALVFHKGKPSMDTAGFIKAATVFQQWTNDGYFSPGYQGLSDQAVLNQFDAGQAGFFLEGDWYSGPVYQALGSKAGFWVPTTATGGPGEGWSIPKNSPDPKLAAEWISTMLSPNIQALLMKSGDIPVIKPSSSALAGASPLMQSATTGWSAATKGNTLVPYLDYATPNFLNQEMAGVQELQGNRVTPSALMKALQSDYTTYWASQS
jgi:raffinose/stachyose/melibiose transport system substrate-binding protein